jgi:hypothetical protein
LVSIEVGDNSRIPSAVGIPFCIHSPFEIHFLNKCNSSILQSYLFILAQTELLVLFFGFCVGTGAILGIGCDEIAALRLGFF